MIIALLSDMAGPSSVDGCRSGFALGLVDPLGVVFLFLVLGRRARVDVDVGIFGRAVAARRLDRAVVAGDEVTQHFLGDEEAVLELGDRLGRRLEEDDVVRPLAMMADGVGKATTAPVRD